MPSGHGPAIGLPALAPPAAHAEVGQQIPDVLGLVVGAWLDLAAVRSDDEQVAGMAIVVEQLQQLLSVAGLLLGGRRIDRHAVEDAAELLLLGAVEPATSVTAHADRVDRQLRHGVGECVEREGGGVAPDDRLSADVEAEGLQQVRQNRSVFPVPAQVVLVRPRSPDRD